MEALGFQLSVAATVGVLWLGPLAAASLPAPVPQGVRPAVGMVLGAQAAAVPVLALTLGRLEPASVPANLVGLPAAAPPILLGVIAAAVEPVAPWLAVWVCRLAGPFLLALIAVARAAAALPGASLTLAGPVRLVPAAVVVGLVALARRRG